MRQSLQQPLILEILRRFPDFAPAQKHLASLYLETPDKRAEAYELAVKARTALPDDPELAKFSPNLATIDRILLMPSNSCDKAPKRGLWVPRDLYYLGMSHLKSNQKSKSREALDQALAAGLQDPFASDARRTIT